jgi:hypothetical protein
MSVDSITQVGASPVTGAIRKAAQATGASFQYLLATAKVESDLNPNLTMRSSTATGLFQFIEQTWLATLKQAGPAFGYGHYSDAISQSASGRYTVEDPMLQSEIMQLRRDPTANALMGGVFTQQNAAVMASRLGRTPSEGELYIGHFFGPYAGTKAIALATSNPDAIAAEIFPAAAQANRPIFYDRQGNARTIAGVCTELARRYQAARTPAGPAPAVTAAPLRPPAPIPAAVTTRSAPPATAVLAIEPASLPAPLSAAFAFAGGTDQPAASRPSTPSASAGGVFHSMFHTGERREAIAPTISELWSGPGRPMDDSRESPLVGRPRSGSREPVR